MVKETSLRKNMVEELMKEIKGPRFGVNEVISYDPWSEYLSGLMIPIRWVSNPHSSSYSADDEDLLQIDDSGSEDSSNEDNITNYSTSKIDPKDMPTSFGLSFYSENPNPKLDICATWGRYYIEYDSEEAFSLNGTLASTNSEKKIWKRYSFGEIFEIEINEEDEEDETISKSQRNGELNIIKTLKNFESEKEIEDREEDGYIKIHIRRRESKKNIYVFTIYMLNDLEVEPNNKKSRPDIDKCIFQPSMRINCDENILKNKYVKMINDSEKELEFLYQNKPTKAIGHMCSAIWNGIDYGDEINIEQIWPDYEIRAKNNKKYEDFETPQLRTEFVPLYPATLPNFELEENDKLNSDDLIAKDLANKSPDELYETLINLPKLYDEWINEKESELSDSKVEDNEIAKKLIEKEKNASSRIKKGIELIREEDLVYSSFCFANKTIALQNKWSQDVKNKDKEDGKEFEEFKWRPFQIAFFLMNLEDVYNEESENKDTLDLLWIPTGGGKTEAYLGIMAYTIALRRLKAYKNNETGAGTSIISRYTLRLLTVQQFRRTLKMITAAEYLRVQNCENQIGWRPKHSKIEGNWIYGSTRFSTGLWVGGAVSPLHLLKSGETMDLLRGKEDNSSYKKGEPAQILKCPVCGSWLSVPETGLNDGTNELHIVIDSKTMSKIELEDAIKKIIEDSEYDIDFGGIVEENHKPGFYTMALKIYGPISRNQYKKEIAIPISKLDCEIASLSPFNIGYFSSLKQIEGKKVQSTDDYDFEIWCTNPKCELNHIEWVEGSPYPCSESPDFPDGNYKRTLISPFEEKTRMPIPAYLIDDHIYTRCPTVIISTADKIARLSFEPKASAIFGNVTHYNKYLGYNRNKDNIKELYPQLPKDFYLDISEYNESIKPLKAPDLIIQDELHLIDGPLGSLFGLYEAMVSAIIEKQGGNPKYIASTATISNAEKQVDLLFSKKFSQFPPHGLDISDNFFVREYDDAKAWDDENPGRLYLGFYPPARGPLTPIIRIWSRMARVGEEFKNNSKSKNFWTVVGYHNSIRELGGALALYRDDIKNRLDVISSSKDHRQLEEENLKELSSRIDSTELPIILDDLERDGLDEPRYDAIFTTSMFGTGVDVSHLSLMIMNGQPKTTGSYIQATGRIGRKKGGLIVDFLRPGKPRDLNHYEMFPSFHSRIYLDVEPVSVSPFSKGCLSRGLGPSMVAFLRNAADLEEEWERNQGKTIQNGKSEEDIDFVFKYLRDRLLKMDYFNKKDEDLIDSILKNLDKHVKKWKKVANEIEGKSPFEMYEYIKDKPKKSVVLGDTGHNYEKNIKVVYKNAPQSLRDVEETIEFWV